MTAAMANAIPLEVPVEDLTAETAAEALAWLLNGALVDAALRIANAEHPPESLARACQALDVLLDGLLME